MASNSTQSDFIDIKEIISTYWSKWYYFVISVFICAVIGYCIAKVKQPLYQVRANVVLADNNNGPGGGALNAMGSLSALFGAQAEIEDEIFIISSHSVYKEVVKDLNLNISHYVKPNFLVRRFEFQKFPVQIYPAPGIVDTLMSTLKFDIHANAKGKVDVSVKVKRNKIVQIKDATFPVIVDTEYGKYTLEKTVFYPEGESLHTLIDITGFDSAAEDIAEEIGVDMASKRSNVIKLGIRTTDPIYGEAILNDVIKNYNKRGIDVKNIQGEKTEKFIDERLVVIQKELDEAEANIQRYKETHGIVDLVADAQYNYAAKGEAERRLIEEQTKAEVLRLTKDFLSKPENAYSPLLISEMSNTGLSNALGSYNELVLKRMNMLNNAKSDNTSLRLLTEQIDAMRQSIQASAAQSLESTMLSIKELQKQVNKNSSSLGNIPSQERQYLDLLRQQELKQELYLFLLKSREENSILLANAVPKAEIVDEAYTRKDTLGMDKKAIFAIWLLIGLLLPPVLIYIQKLLRDKFDTREEVEKLTSAPILGEICIDKSGERLVVANRKTSSIAELFRLMRTNLQFVLNNADDKVILFTSTSSGEGKSFISINLASSLALLDKKVLLVGMDIRKPRLKEYLNLPHSIGLTQYLSDSSIKLDDVILKQPVAPNLDIIVAGPVPPNPSELLQSKAVDELFEKLRGMYDYIVIDSAPVGMVSDTFTLNRIADAAVYVCRANYTLIKDIRFFNSIYEDGRLKKLSLVVNGTNTKKGYGYGYGEKTK